MQVQTLKQQKQFIKLRYNKKRFVLTWFNVGRIVIYIILFIIMFKVYAKLLDYIPFEIKLWHSILFLLIFPLLSNYILSRFGLQKKGVKIF